MREGFYAHFVCTSVVDGGVSDNVILVSADNVTVDGFIIQNALANAKAGVWIEADGASISNNQLINNYEGIYLINSYNSTKTICNFIGFVGTFGFRYRNI